MREPIAARATLLAILWAVAAIGLAPAVGAAAVASAPTNWKGVTLDLVSVERKGSVLTVKWAVTNGGAEEARVRFGLVGDNAKTYLVDEENGTKYFVLTDKEKRAVASKHDGVGGNVWGVNDLVAAGSTMRYWAKFPAPPPAVKKLTILFDETEPFEEVPIAEK